MARTFSTALDEEERGEAPPRMPLPDGPAVPVPDRHSSQSGDSKGDESQTDEDCRTALDAEVDEDTERRGMGSMATLPRSPDALLAGKVQHTADRHRLATGIPKYEYMMTSNLTRHKSADEALWQSFTEPSRLPQHSEAAVSEATAPYSEEIVCKGTKHRCKSILGLPMLRPEGRVASLWTAIMATTDASYTAFLVPLSFAFFHDVRVFNWMSVLDILGGALYVLDVLFSLHIGVVLTKSLHARLVLDGRLVASLYIKHSTFFLDVLAAFPVFLEVVLLCIRTPNDHLKVLSQITAWLRLVRMLRLLPLLRSLAVLSLTGHYNRRMLRFMPASALLGLHVLYMFLWLANLLCCAWFYTAVAEGLENSWLRSVGALGEDLSGASGVTQYIASFYYVVTFLTTIGFGDVSSTTTAERVVTTVMMFIGVAFFGFLLSVLQSIIQRGGRSGRRADLFRSRLPDVEAWMTYSELPHKLRASVRSYYADVWVRHEEVDERRLFDDLPFFLRAQIASHLTDAMLLESKAFGHLDESARHLVAAMFRPVPVAPGHDLFPQGGPADCIYVLQDGEVALYRNTVEIERIGAPYLLGEVAVLNLLAPEDERNVRQPFAVRALTLSMTWELRISDLEPLLAVHPGLERHLLVDVIDVFKRLHKHQPKERLWGEMRGLADQRLAQFDARGEPEADEKAEPQQQRRQALHRRQPHGTRDQQG